MKKLNLLLVAVAMTVAACGTDNNRKLSNNPRISFNEVQGQSFSFVVTATSSAATPVTAGSLPTEIMSGSAKPVTVETATLKLAKAGEWSFLVSPTEDCDTGGRPDPISKSIVVRPGANPPVAVIFDRGACTLKVTEDKDNPPPVTNPTTQPTETPLPQGKVELKVEGPAPSYTAIAGATVRLDVPGLSSQLVETTDSKGAVTFEGLECGITITRTITASGFITQMKEIQIPCSGGQVYVNTVVLDTPAAPLALTWVMTSYFLAAGSCTDATKLVYETDGSGNLSSAPYAGPVTITVTGSSPGITVSSAGIVCAASAGVSVDLYADDGTRTTLVALRVRTY